MARPELYAHQVEVIDGIRQAMTRHRRVILCARTGVGKTRMAKAILMRCLEHPRRENQSGHAAFMVHRRGLVFNASNSFRESPELPHAIAMSGERWESGYRTHVCSIDSVNSWFVQGNDMVGDHTYDLIFFDEAHSHLSKFRTYLDAHDRRREALGLHPAYVIGLTATPRCKGMADVFEWITMGPPGEWLQQHGYASTFRYITGKKGELGKLVKKGGEYTKDSVCAAMDGLAGDFILDWKTKAEGRPTIGFFPRLSQAQEAQRRLEEAGVQARYLDGETPDDERHNLYQGLSRGDYSYLCNVGVVERGTDIPRVSCVQLCVATASLVRYIQMIGRGSRVHPEKSDCLVLDHGENVLRLGFWEDEHAWVLDNDRKKTLEQSIRPTIECPQCGALYRGGTCKACGYEPPHARRNAEQLLFTGSELREIGPGKKKQGIQNVEQFFVGQLYKAARCGCTWRQACGMAKAAAKQRGTDIRIPRHFVIGDTRYEAIPYGHPDGYRRVSAIFPFMTRGRRHA